MKNLLLVTVVLPLFSLSGWCQPRDAKANPLGFYEVNASLNDSVWFGKVRFSSDWHMRFASPYFMNCYTDLSHFKEQRKQSDVTGCMIPCVPTQNLVFKNIPIQLGQFEVFSPNFSDLALGVIVEYELLIDGDGVTDIYSIQKDKPNWLRITAYDPKHKIIEGTFELNMIGTSGRTVHFAEGRFRGEYTDL